MGLFGSIIGGGAKIVGAWAANRKMSKAYNNVQNSLNNQLQEATDLFNRRYGESATQRSDVQAMLNLTDERIRQRSQQAAGASAVMGGTMAAQAAVQQMNNQALSDTASRIAASADARKDQLENNYQAQKAQITDKKNQMTMEKAQAQAKAITDSANAVAGAAKAIPI